MRTNIENSLRIYLYFGRIKICRRKKKRAAFAARRAASEALKRFRGQSFMLCQTPPVFSFFGILVKEPE